MGERLFYHVLTLTLSALVLSACGAPDGPQGGREEASPVAKPGVPVVAGSVAVHTVPSWQEAANAVYEGVLDGAVALADAQWQGEPYVEGGASAPRAGLAEDFLLTGDLDGDGAEEAVVLLWSSAGGSGTFDYLAVLGRDPGGVVINRATAALGDRVKVRSAAIDSFRVLLETVQAGPGDAACCPGQKMLRTFALEGDTMTETSTEDRGRLSLADLVGEWRLVRFGVDEEIPDEVHITLQFENSQIAGKAACNRYTGQLREGDAPGALALSGPMAVTRMMCPPPLMEWEQRYLQALQGLERYSFTAGKLVLSWRGDNGGGSLLFDRVAEAPASEE